MNQSQPIEKLWNAKYVFLIIVSCITGFGFNMIYTMVVDYATVSLRSSLAAAGVISGIFSIAALFVRPVAGAASDFFSKKTLFVLSTGIIGVAVLGYAFAPNVPVMIVLRILHGAAFGFSSTVNIALVSCCIPKSRFGEGLGYFGLGQIFAQAVGPGIGAAIQAHFGYHVLFILISAINTLAVIMLLRFDFGESAKSKSERSLKTSFAPKNLIATEVLMFTMIGGLFSFTNGIVNSFLKTFCDSRHIPGFASFFTVSAIVLFLIRLIVGRVADKRGLTGIVNFSLAATVLAMACIARSFTVVMLLTAAVLKAAGQGGGQISLQAGCLKKVDESRSGVASGTFYIGADIGQGVGPAVGGAFTATFGYTSTFLWTGGLLVIGLIAFNIYQKRQKSLKPETAETT